MNSKISHLIQKIFRVILLGFHAIAMSIDYITKPAFKQVSRWERSVAERSKLLVPKTVSLRVTGWSFLVTLVVYISVVAASAPGIYRNFPNPTKWDTFMLGVFPYPAAVVQHATIPISRLMWEIDARENYNKAHGFTNNREQTAQFVTDQIISRELYRQALKKNGYHVANEDINNKMKDIVNKIGSQAAFLNFIHTNYGDTFTESKFRIWVEETAQEAAVENNILENITLRHIVIAVPDGASDATVQANLKKIQDIKSKITSTEQFAAAAKDNSDDLASRDVGGELGRTFRSGTSNDFYTAEFEKDVFELPVGVVSEPIRSSKGWHLVMVDSKEGTVPTTLSDYTLDLKNKAKIRVWTEKVK